MNTIEERANIIYPSRVENSYFDKRYNYENEIRKNIYIKGATDQQAIDLANAKAFAKKWLDEIINLWLPDLKDEPYYGKALEDIYNKLEKAMKQ